MAYITKLKRFEILRRPDGALWELARGSSGILYKALDTDLESHVALKIMNSAYLDSERAREEFLEEISTIISFRHSNLATLIDAGDVEGRVFCATEYIEGETLEERVSLQGGLDPVAALRIAIQLTRVLVAAAERILVHGNISPSKIMLSRGSIVKLTDYGLFRCLAAAWRRSGPLARDREEQSNHSLTVYHSSEQSNGKTVDIRSDIYSLGTTLLFMLAGQPLEVSTIELAFQDQLPTDAMAFPQPLSALLGKMLAKRPEDRFQAPLELESELDKTVSELQRSDLPPAEPANQPHRPRRLDGSSTDQVNNSNYLIINDLPSDQNADRVKEIHCDRVVALYPLPQKITQPESGLTTLTVSMPMTAPASAVEGEEINRTKGAEQSLILGSPFRILTCLAALLLLAGIATLFFTQFGRRDHTTQVNTIQIGRENPSGPMERARTSKNLREGTDTKAGSTTADPKNLAKIAAPRVAPATPADVIVTDRSELSPPSMDPTKALIMIDSSRGGTTIEPGGTDRFPKSSVPSKLGRIILRSDPIGSAVEVANQGREIIGGRTPIAQENLPVGQYLVRIRCDGWPTYEERVNVSSDAAVIVDHKFQTVKVTLQSDPSGTSIFMGEKELGKTPLTVMLPPSPVDLVSRSGTLPPVTKRVIPDPNGSTVVEFRHDYGVLTVSSNNSDAEVIVGGVDMGKAPIEEILPPGPQQVTFQVDGLSDQMQKVIIQPGQRAVVGFKVSLDNVAVAQETENQAPAERTPSPPEKTRHETRNPAVHSAITHRPKNRSASRNVRDESCAIETKAKTSTKPETMPCN